MSLILDQARRFLISDLEGKEPSYENIHPWRVDWRFVVHHSFRVEAYALKIMQAEDRFTADQIIQVRLACILHDIGRMIKREGHAERGAGIVQQWLSDHPQLTQAVPDPQGLVHLIKNHSDKSSQEADELLGVLKDADTLDEIGVMSVFMAANHLNTESSYFFIDLLERIQSYELNFCDRKMKILNYLESRRILAEKRAFVEAFISQLNSELQGTESIKDLIEEVLVSVNS